MLRGSLFLDETSKVNWLICNLQDKPGGRGRLISERRCFEASFFDEEVFNVPALHQKTTPRLLCASARSAPPLPTSLRSEGRDSVLRNRR